MGEFLEALSDFAIQAELWGISTTLQRIREEQWLAASEIVAGLDTVREAVDQLRASVDKQTQVLERGFATLDARLDFEAYLLGDIRHILKHPVETKALDYREMAQKLLQKRFYDNALKELQNSLSLNEYDFTCHLAVALIRFEHLDDDQGAIEACQEVLKWTQLDPKVPDDPTPSHYASYALLVMGRISEESGELGTALQCYTDACLASPDYGDCFRYYARAAVKLSRQDLALPTIRAAIMVDVGQAVLIEQDEEFRGLGGDLKRVLSSIRSDACRTATQLSDLANEGLTTYEQAFDKCRKTIGATTEIATLMVERSQAEGAVARAVQLERSGGLVDLYRATREYWWSICGLASQASFLQSLLQEHAESSERTLRNSAASFQAETAKQADSLSIEEQEKSSRRGCGLTFLALTFLPAAVAFFIASLRVGGEDAQAFRILAIMVSALFLILLVIIDIGRRPSARERELSANAAELRNLAREKELEVRRLRDIARGVSEQLTTLTVISHAAAQAMASCELQCALTLLDSGAREDGYDEAKLAHALVEVFREYTNSKPLSLAQAKEIVRDCPRVFLSGLSVPDAEAIAAYLRSRFNVSVGVKRRFIGEFPPHPRAIQGPSLAT